MKKIATVKKRCAIYTRKSTDEGLEQDFNSLDAQRESCEYHIKAKVHEGWELLQNRYDDGGFSGGDMHRPALAQLMADIKAGMIDIVVVYKIDRLSRSMKDFMKLIELFDEHKVSFVSVTQSPLPKMASTGYFPTSYTSAWWNKATSFSKASMKPSSVKNYGTRSGI